MTDTEVKEGNEVIKKFMGLPDGCPLAAYNYSMDWQCLMPVVEKIHTSKNYQPYLGDPRGVEIEIKPNSCLIYLPDPSEGYDYVNGSYEAPHLFSVSKFKMDGGTLKCVYHCAIEYITWYNSLMKITA